jgi:hypothetical protein
MMQTPRALIRDRACYQQPGVGQAVLSAKLRAKLDSLSAPDWVILGSALTLLGVAQPAATSPSSPNFLQA